MATEVVRPQDLEPLKKPLVESVINAYMRKDFIDVGGLTSLEGSCKKGEFRFEAFEFDVQGSAGRYYVSYPDGKWQEDETFWWDSDKSAGDQVGEFTLFDATEKYAEIESMVNSWIDPWINECPSPNVFTNQINSIANVAKHLYIGDQVEFGAKGSKANDNAPTSGDTDLRSAVDEFKVTLYGVNGGMAGQAIDALQRTYTLDIARTIGGQRGLATAAGLAITAEAMALNAAYTTLRDFMKKATHDFNNFADCSGDGGEDVSAELNAVGAVAGLAGATVGIAFPPFGAAMGVVSGITGVASLMFSGDKPVKKDPLVLSGNSYAEYWTSFTNQIKAISKDLKDAEDDIAKGCNAILADYRNNPDNYSLTRGEKRNKQGANDSLAPFLNLTISVRNSELKKYAGAAESIGDHQKAVATRLGGVDASGNPAALVQDEWYRGYLPDGAIGRAYNGPYPEFLSVIEALTDLMIGESKTSYRVAEQCIDLATSFRNTDAQNQAAIKKQKQEYEKNPLLPNVNKK